MKPFNSVVTIIKVIVTEKAKRPYRNAATYHVFPKIFWSLFIVIAIIPLTDTISQTAIAVSRIKGIVYIAADSRVKRGGNIIGRMVCKIQRINQSNYYFAIAGIYEDPQY